MAVVGSAQVLIVPTFKGLQRSIGQGLIRPLEQGVGAADPGKRIGDRVVSGLGTALKVGAGATIAAAAATVGTALVQGFGRLQDLENATATLEGLGHSAQGVENIMDDALASVKGTAFGMGEAATAAASAVAAGVEPGEDLQRTLTLMGDAATIAQTDLSTMGSIVNKVATSDMMQMDVANQLMDAGIPILQMVGDEMGVTAEEARELASAGEVSFEIFQNALEEGVGGAALKSGETLSGAFANTKASLGRIGASLLEPFYGMAGDFLNWAMDMLGPIEEWAESIQPMIQGSLENFAGWIQNSFVPAAKNVISAFQAIWEWVVANRDWLIPLTIAVGTFITTFLGVLGVKSAIDSVKTSFALLNVVMKANPIGLVIAGIAALVAGLTWFFTQTETGRQIWAGFTQFLGDAWNWLWNDVLQPVFGWIGEAWGNLMQWFSDTWNNILKPVWDAIAATIQWLWTAVLFVVFAAIWTAWTVMSTAIKWAWDNVLKPVWDLVASVALWLWNSVLSPVFSWIGTAWQVVLLGMQYYWNNVLKPVWDMIASAAQWLWRNVLQPVFGYIASQWRTTLDNMKWVWDNVLKPAWDALVSAAQWLWGDILSPIFTWIGDKWSSMSDSISSIYSEYIKPVFDRFGDIVRDLRDKFDTAVDNIAKAWDKLKEVAAKPIYFVIERVLNQGLIDGFNNLVDWIPGVDGLSHISIPNWMSQYGFADGGHTGRGFFGTNSKYDPAGVVHADEFVINQSSRRRFEHLHPGLLTHINRHGDLAGYASGGLVRPVDGQLTSRFGPRWGSHHSGVDWAVPTGTPVRAALPGTVARAGWNVVTGRTGIGMLLAHEGNRNTYYGHLSRLAARVGDTVSKGQAIALSGNTGNSTGPHLHFETWTGGRPVNPLSYMGGLPASESGGEGGGGFDILAPFRAIGDRITSWISDQFPDGGIMVDAGIGAAKYGFDTVLEWAENAINSIGDFFSGGDSAGSTDAAQDQVRDVAARYGWDSGAQWSALVELVRRESSWNVNAANPNSSARGLFQKMTSIHGPVESTAGGQAEWGLNYIRGRHNNPVGALAHHDRRNWYADGGHVDALFRDQGGNLPPGLSMILNNTGRDEAILNHQQWSDIHSLARRGGAGGERHYHYHAGQDGASIGDFTREIDHYARRLERV